MKREVAEGIMDAMKRTELALGALDIAVRSVESEAERRPMLRLLGETIHNLHLRITLAVAQEFPDLHPDGPSRTY